MSKTTLNRKIRRATALAAGFGVVALGVGQATPALATGSSSGSGGSQPSKVSVLANDIATIGNWSLKKVVNGQSQRQYSLGSFGYALPNSTGQYEYEVGGDLTTKPSLDEVGGKGFGDNGYTGEKSAYKVHGPVEVQEQRVLQLPGGTTRRPTACFGGDVSVSLPLPAGDYRISVYLLDYDRNGRIQTTIATGDGLATAAAIVEDAKEGVYVLYNVHTNGTSPVNVHSIITAGPNAVLSGVFVDPLGSTTTGVTAAGFDKTTKGDWIGKKGATGYVLCGAKSATGAVTSWSAAQDVSSGLPGYSIMGSTYAWGEAFPNKVATSPAFAYAWTGWGPQDSSDPRFLTFWKNNPTSGGAATPGDRRATAWDSGDDILPYSGGARPLIADVHVPKNSSTSNCGFKVSFYFLDLDNNRTQNLTLQNMTTGGNVVDTRTISNFSKGLYASYTVPQSTDLKLTLTKVAGVNSVLSGIFWDEIACTTSGGTQGGGSGGSGGSGGGSNHGGGSNGGNHDDRDCNDRNHDDRDHDGRDHDDRDGRDRNGKDRDGRDRDGNDRDNDRDRDRDNDRGGRR